MSFGRKFNYCSHFHGMIFFLWKCTYCCLQLAPRFENLKVHRFCNSLRWCRRRNHLKAEFHLSMNCFPHINSSTAQSHVTFLNFDNDNSSLSSTETKGNDSSNHRLAHSQAVSCVCIHSARFTREAGRVARRSDSRCVSLYSFPYNIWQKNLA